jgi:hypothetical protein
VVGVENQDKNGNMPNSFYNEKTPTYLYNKVEEMRGINESNTSCSIKVGWLLVPP